MGIEQDRFEQEKNNFHEDVRQHYLKQVKADPKNWVVLDATGSREALLEQLIEKLKEHGWLQ